jgi:molybdate transport system substrate-binding protein
VKVMSGLAVEVAINRWIKPGFENQTDFVLDIDWRPTAALMKSIAAGDRSDVIIAITASMNELGEQGIIRSDTRVVLADAVLGVGVKAGARHPDVSSVDAFKMAMVSAEGVAYSRAGASGIYFARLIEKLGIAEAVNKKAVVIPMGFTAEKVAIGEAELAIQQISELISVPGIEVAGPFPDELQVTSTFEAALFTEAQSPTGGMAFLDALRTPAAGQAYKDGGLVPRLA